MIHVIIGTRAQIIKMAPVMKGLSDRGLFYNFILLAQHKETMYEIMDQFGIKPPDTVVCDIGKDITRTWDMVIWSIRVLIYGFINRNKVFKNDKKGVVLIHGDAPPLLLGGLIAKFQGLKVAQIEAGLRSFNLLKPFPEELTRVLAAKLGLVDIFFCQDEKAMEHVKQYNREVHCTYHNTILDALKIAGQQKENGFKPMFEKYALVTLHRFETISNRENLTRAVNYITEISKKIPLLFILHPPTRVALEKFDLFKVLESEQGCQLLPRLGFFEFNRVLKRARFIISDGGSNQEESSYLGIPCLLLRNETERQEGLGKNVVLSRFNEQVVQDFVENHHKYRNKPVATGESPTSRIIDRIQAFA